MKRHWTRIGVALLLLAVVCPLRAMAGEETEHLYDIFLRCRHPRGPTALDDLRAYAQAHGLSDAEMSGMLVELAKAGLDDKGDVARQRLARCALYELPNFGGIAAVEFLRNVMRTGPDAKARLVAARSCLRMKPESWEAWLREVVSDGRFGDHDRFLAYEEVFQIGRDGDDGTRQRVMEVMNEMRASDASRVNRNRLGGWVAELEGGVAWEAWLREVVAGEGFYPANREHAFKLALKAGQNGDVQMRQRVIEVFGELCEDESIEVDRATLRQWIAELEKLP